MESKFNVRYGANSISYFATNLEKFIFSCFTSCEAFLLEIEGRERLTVYFLKSLRVSKQ